MRVIGTELIEKFKKKHPDSRNWFRSWLAETRKNRWQTPTDVTSRYRSASIIEGNRIIFNIRGNHYRMEVKISFQNETVLIKRIGTHTEYDRWEK